MPAVPIDTVVQFIAPHPTLSFQGLTRKACYPVNRYNAHWRYEQLLVARKYIDAYLFARLYSNFIPASCADALRLFLIEKRGVKVDAIEYYYALRQRGFHAFNTA